MGKRITARVTCPACNGQGKSYGSRYCGRCKGRHVVTERITIEDTEIESKETSQVVEDIAESLEPLQDIHDEMVNAAAQVLREAENERRK